MILLRTLLEAESDKARGIEKPNSKASHPNKTKPASSMTKDKKEPEKKEEPKPATMNKQQAGTTPPPSTAATSDIQKQNGMSSLVAPVKHSAEKEANAMDGEPEGLPPQNQYRLQPAASQVGKPVTAQDVVKIIPPEIDPQRNVRTIIPGEQIQLCGPNDFKNYINNPEESEKVLERNIIVPDHELELFLKAFHIGKNMSLPSSEFTQQRTIHYPWPNIQNSALVIIRLGANKEGEIDVVEKNGHLVRPEGPEARCVGVSKLLMSSQVTK